MRLGDIDGDGDLDCIVGGFPATQVFINDGTGAFIQDTSNALATDGSANFIELFDLNEDGMLDVLFGKQNNEDLFWKDVSSWTNPGQVFFSGFGFVSNVSPFRSNNQPSCEITTIFSIIETGAGRKHFTNI